MFLSQEPDVVPKERDSRMNKSSQISDRMGQVELDSEPVEVDTHQSNVMRMDRLQPTLKRLTLTHLLF